MTNIDLIGLCNLLRAQVSALVAEAYQVNIRAVLNELKLVGADEHELLCWLRCNDNSLLKGVIFSETGEILGETKCFSRCTWTITQSWSGIAAGTEFQAPLTVACLDSVLSEHCWHVTTMHLLGIDGSDNALFS